MGIWKILTASDQYFLSSVINNYRGRGQKSSPSPPPAGIRFKNIGKWGRVGENIFFHNFYFTLNPTQILYAKFHSDSSKMKTRFPNVFKLVPK